MQAMPVLKIVRRAGIGLPASGSLSPRSSPFSPSASVSARRDQSPLRAKTDLWRHSTDFGSAIYTPSVPGLMEEFGISQVGAISGLTLFVAAYGISPSKFMRTGSLPAADLKEPGPADRASPSPAVILSPIQELPQIGRNPVYIIGLALFVIFQIPEILAKNMATVLVFRFFSGFVGGPALATGGASMGDIFPPQHLAVAIGAWGASTIFRLRCGQRGSRAALLTSSGVLPVLDSSYWRRLCSDLGAGRRFVRGRSEELALAFPGAPVALRVHLHRPLLPPARDPRIDHPCPPRRATSEAHRKPVAQGAGRTRCR